MIEMPVKVRFNADKNDLNKAMKKGGSGGGVTGGGSGDKKTGKNIAGMLGKLAVIAGLVGALLALFKPFIDLFKAFTAALMMLVVTPFKDFFDEFMDGIKVLSDFLSGEISFEEFVSKLKDAAIDALGAFIANFITFAEGFFVATMETLGAIIKGAWEILKTVGIWIWDNVIKPGWEMLKEVGVWIWENFIKPAWEYLKDVGLWIWNQILKPAWEFLKDVGMWIWDKILKPAWDTLAGSIKTAWNIIKTAFQFVVDKVKGWLNKINLFSRSGGSDGSRAFGGIIPEDGLYHMHAGEQVSRGNTSNVTNKTLSPVININVSGRMDQRQINEVARSLNRELSLFGRL